MSFARILSLILVLAAPLTLLGCGDNDREEVENEEVEDD